MNILRFDSVGGAAGDMILAALLDLGADLKPISDSLTSFVPENLRIEVTPSESHGLRGCRLQIIVDDVPHPHRTFADIQTLIESADLDATVRDQSLAVFGRLAQAEGSVHGKPASEVHFHEVGALDSIIDIVGCCLALKQLNVDAVSVGPLPLGCGTLECRHGTYPVPAPATMELIKGLETVQTDIHQELVTPTGAALLAEWQTPDFHFSGGRCSRSGYGLGTRDIPGRAGAIRASLYESSDATENTDRCLVLESNIDDMAPELAGALAEQLRAAGALDVFTTAAQMKKQRPGILLTVLAHPADRSRLLDIVFRGSTTFGVREYAVQRTILVRRFESVQTPYGDVQVKIGTWRGEDVTRSPEIDDCIRLAEEANISIRTVYELAKNVSHRNVE